MEQTKDRKEWLGFIIGILLFVLLSILDSPVMGWFVVERVFNLANNSLLYSLLLPGMGTIHPAISYTLPGIILAIFPVLSIVFIKKNKRIPSIIFAVLNLILSSILCIAVMTHWGQMGLGWILYAVSAVIILLYSLHPVPYRQSYYRISVLLAILSIILSLLLSCYDLLYSSPDELAYRGGSFWQVIHRMIGNRISYGWGKGGLFVVYSVGLEQSYTYGILFWPLSRGILLFTIGIGLRDKAQEAAKKKEKQALSTQRGNLPMSDKSKVVAALLAFFLGTTGAHRYYLGYKKQGIIQTCGLLSVIIGSILYAPAMLGNNILLLFITIMFFFYGIGAGIWAFIDFICILTGKLTPQDGSYRLMQVQVIQQAPSEGNNLTETLEKLAKLHEQGVLTDEEFQQKKAELLSKM